MFTIFLPIGIAFIIEQLVDLSRMPGGITGLILLLTAVEGGLIIFKVYPKSIRLSSRNRLNALIFYLGVNLISRIIVSMYAVWLLGNALSGK